MVRDATKQLLRVQTPPLGGCWHVVFVEKFQGTSSRSARSIRSSSSKVSNSQPHLVTSQLLSMGLVYLPTFIVDSNGQLVGKYTIHWVLIYISHIIYNIYTHLASAQPPAGVATLCSDHLGLGKCGHLWLMNAHDDSHQPAKDMFFLLLEFCRFSFAFSP